MWHSDWSLPLVNSFEVLAHIWNLLMAKVEDL